MNIRVRIPIYIYTAKMISKRHSSVYTTIFIGYTKALYVEDGEEIVSYKWGSDSKIKRDINDK